MPLKDTSTSRRPHTRAQTRAEAQKGDQSASNSLRRSVRIQEKAEEAKLKNQAARPPVKKSSLAIKSGRKAQDRSQEEIPRRHIGPKTTVEPLQKSAKATTGNKLLRTKSLVKKSRTVEETTKEEHDHRADHNGQLIQVKKTTEPRRAKQSLRPSEQTQKEAVSNWLEEVSPVSPEHSSSRQSRTNSQVPVVDLDALSDMASLSRSLTRTSDNASTEKPPPNKRGVGKISEMKLRNRRIALLESTEDHEWLAERYDILNPTLPSITTDQAADDRRTIQELLDQLEIAATELEIVATEEHHRLINVLRFKLDKSIAESNYPIVLDEYFDHMVEKSSGENEAVLQRSVMVNIFHQYWIGKNFDWNAEGLWSQSESTRLPSMVVDEPGIKEDRISMPKPDLAISFRFRLFQERFGELWSINRSLYSAMKPEGFGRCFPFLFMEVKKSTDMSALRDAYWANLHTASQALFNIYLWMNQANQVATFLEKVRVFTLVFNADKLSVCVHRAIQLPDGNLQFKYYEFSPLKQYSKNRVCSMINAILTHYALKELLPILFDTFEAVTGQKSQNVDDSQQTDHNQRIPETDRRDKLRPIDENGEPDGQDPNSERHAKRKPETSEPAGLRRTQRLRKAVQQNTGNSFNFSQVSLGS